MRDAGTPLKLPTRYMAWSHRILMTTSHGSADGARGMFTPGSGILLNTNNAAKGSDRLLWS